MKKYLISFLLTICLLPASGWGQHLWDNLYPNHFPPVQVNTYMGASFSWDTAYGGLIAYSADSPGSYRHTIYVRLDKLGDTVWAKKDMFHTHGEELATAICRMPNGDFIIAAACDTDLGTTGTSGTYHMIRRVDSSGNELFTKIISGPVYNADKVPFFVTNADAGGYYVSSEFTDDVYNSSYTIDSIVGKMRVQQYNASNVLVASDSFISGDLRAFLGPTPPCYSSPWATIRRPQDHSILKAIDMRPAADGGVFFILDRDTSVSYSIASCAYLPKAGAARGGFVSKYGTQLRLQWVTNLASALSLAADSMFRPRNVFPTSDSGIVVFAQIVDTTVRGGELSMLIKLDKTGHITDTFMNTNPWAYFVHGTETSTGQYLFETHTYNNTTGWQLGLTLFDKHFKFLNYALLPLRPQPSLFSAGLDVLLGITANQYGGAFAPYFKDTGVYGSLQNLIPASLNFDSALNRYPSSVSGKIVRDDNRNCAYDPGTDRPLVSRILLVRDPAAATSFYTCSDANGNWMRPVPHGTYNITHTLPPNKAIECPSAGFPGVNLTTSTALTGFNFYDTLLLNRGDMKVLLSASHFLPGLTQPLHAWVINNGGLATSDTLRIIKPSTLNYVSASPAPTSISGNNLMWALNNMAPDSIVGFSIQLSTPATTSIGTNLVFSASVNDPLDIYPADNTDTLRLQVSGPYDPNCKTVNRPLHTSARKDWVYTIEFQNTGNYPAQDVVLVDDLHPLLNPSSLRILQTSHGIPKMLWQEGNRIVFRFDNIYLADSVHNEPASHGYLTYLISPVSNAGVGDSITNIAGIFFDYNVPVYTNTTLNIISEKQTGIPQIAQVHHFDVFPNPTTGDINIVSDFAGEISLFDMQGRCITRFAVIPGKKSMQLPAGLPADVYTLHGTSSDGEALGVLRMVLR